MPLLASKPLRVMMVGAHPDDAEIHFGGMAALYAAAGHKVLSISMTDGRAGHYRLRGALLARRRRREACAAARILGAQQRTLNNPDGRLIADIRTRENFIRIARKFAPDIVFTHKHDDYHPDHRATVQVVYDSSYLISVPAIVPDTRPATAPVICHSNRELDGRGIVIGVPIDAMWDRKILALHQHVSQMYEWLPWEHGELKNIPVGGQERLKYLSRVRGRSAIKIAAWCRRHQRHQNVFRRVRYAEAVYEAQVGLKLTPERISRLFPFPHVVMFAD